MFSRTSPSPSRKAKSTVSVSPEYAFSNRFGSILFSLYNPHVAPIFDPLPDSSEPPRKRRDEDEIPPFNSPLCSFKMKTDLEESAETEAAVIKRFDERSRVLVAELGKQEYDIEVSMVPFDVERTGGDRIRRQTPPKKTSDDARSFVERKKKFSSTR